jgi:hypothetical protein
MGNTVPEKESIEHCRYIVMFPILSGFMAIIFTAPGKGSRKYTRLPVPLTDVLTYAPYQRPRMRYWMAPLTQHAPPPIKPASLMVWWGER